MSMLRRALLLSALVAATSTIAAGAASAITLTPGGPFTLASTRLQTFNIPSIGATYTCEWNLNARLLTTEIPLDAQLHKIGGAIGGIVNCNEGAAISMLIAGLGTPPEPWPFGLVPTTGVLHLPNPDGVLLTMLAVRIRITTLTGFNCLFTGRIGLLFKDHTETVILLGGEFTATPTIGDTCLAGLTATKGAGVLATSVEWEIN